MPITLPPISRRGFLATSFAGAAAAVLGRSAVGAEKEVDPNRFFLFSDIHIAADRAAIELKTVMFKNFQQAAQEILAEEKSAAGLIVNGDCAYHTGEAADYATLIDGLKPIREANIPVHLVLGNHDRRDTFWTAFSNDKKDRGVVDGRQTAVLDTEHARIYMLDSLDKTNSTPGELGHSQLKWLARNLDKHEDKPAIVFVHHNLKGPSKPGHKTVAGINDTDEFLEVIVPRKHVKMLVYGHTHNWEVSKLDGLNCVNLPPVAYVFKEGKPNGWIDMQIKQKSASLQLHCLDKNHPNHLQNVELSWR